MRTWSESAGSCLVQLLDRLQDAEPGPDRALGVVLVCHRCAEDGHDRVPDELLDGAAVALDLLPQAGVVGADAGADVLGVSRFRGRGEADEVAEEDGHDLALLLHRRRRLRGQGTPPRTGRTGTRPEAPYRTRGRSARAQSMAVCVSEGRASSDREDSHLKRHSRSLAQATRARALEPGFPAKP